MKVKKLIELLQQFDPNQVVNCYCEDSGLRSDKGPIQFFEINSISDVDGEVERLDDGDGKPWLRVGKTDRSAKFLLLDITLNI